jgi:hypothetical protein
LRKPPSIQTRSLRDPLVPECMNPQRTERLARNAAGRHQGPAPASPSRH